MYKLFNENKPNNKNGKEMLVKDPPRRYYSVFMGSCVYAENCALMNAFITKQDYEEQGGARMCLKRNPYTKDLHK